MRKNTPNEIKRLTNNPGGRPVPTEEEEAKIPLTEWIEAPDDVRAQKYAKAVWDEILPMLMEMCIISESDIPVFAMFCTSFGQYKEANAQLRLQGLVISHKNREGEMMYKKNPLIEIIDKAKSQCRMFASEYGLTPSSRAKFGIVKTPPTEKNKMSEFIN